ncbi:flagellar motor switch protein FliN [Thiomicrorhabdus sp. Kp2]|uniref:flagellar motor switch protein FliN n=1 Tax=Thiomicrorhabdus sp. Kp2 TaxID=1123518 RepID=UPI00041A5A7F|nr:flagellar motor switch protein FliN [Thiomicrorhabdus sp. Kp2]
MSDEDDLSAWGDALAEQADAEGSSADADWGDALAEQTTAEAMGAESISSAAFDELNAERGNSKDKVDLDVLMDIPVTLQLEIGRAKVSIRNLLSYTQGSVVEMDRLAGEPLDLLVNGTLIAHGEVVVINDKFGVRLTDVVSPQERIKKLK